MKAKAVLLGLGLVAVVFGSQGALKFVRTFHEGDKDTYNMHMVATMSMGTADVDMTMTQIVKRVYENGEADMLTQFDAFRVELGGNEIPAPAPPTSTMHVDKNGMPMKTKAAGGDMQHLQFMRFASLFYDRDLKVGETIPVNYTDPDNPKNKTVGTVKVDSLENGVAKLVSLLDVSTDKSDTPMKLAMTTWIDVQSSKATRMEGEMSNMDVQPEGGPPITDMKFTMTKVK